MEGRGPRHTTAICSTALLALGLFMLLSIGCTRAAPGIERSSDGSPSLATLTGTVRGPRGASSIEGRPVEVINIETNERHRVTTNARGFAIKVKPGKYRVQVALQDGESLIRQPGVMHVSRSDDDAHADFVIESAHVARPRHRLLTPVDPALGSPIV